VYINVADPTSHQRAVLNEGERLNVRGYDRERKPAQQFEELPPISQIAARELREDERVQVYLLTAEGIRKCSFAAAKGFVPNRRVG
jgi:hypothetical protein